MSRGDYRVGVDIDGVLLTHAHSGRVGPTGFVCPETDYVIVSGRICKHPDYSDTVISLGADRPIYLRPPWFPGTSQHWKSHIIQVMRLEKFYEDDLGQANDIKKYCPDCEVILVQDGRIVRSL